MPELVLPDWPAPPAVRAFTTTRTGGVSTGAWRSMNLGSHCGDDPRAVRENRDRLRVLLPARPAWLRQVHGTRVLRHDGETGTAREADGMYSVHRGRVCAVLTADCLPVLFCDLAGTRIAAAHAGWRGLAAGVLEAAVAELGADPGALLAWLGPGIGPAAYEVGDEVYNIFTARDPAAATAFRAREGRWLADLYALARLRLARAGVGQVHGGGFCTFGEADRFFSHRRDGVTGRMATLIWLD